MNTEWSHLYHPVEQQLGQFEVTRHHIGKGVKSFGGRG